MPNTGNPWEMFERVFGSRFGMNGFKDARPYPLKGGDIFGDIEISFEEVASGAKKEISFKRRVECRKCNGSGLKDGESKNLCERCSGSGRMVFKKSQGNMIVQRTVTCTQCNGEGKIIEEESKCLSCNGSGFEVDKKTIDLNIPKGINHGKSLVLRGMGHCGKNSGPHGDLLVKVFVKRHDIFIGRGNNIHIDFPLTFTEATLGCTKEVPTIYKNTIAVKIPAGTQSGDEIVKKGYGFPSMNSNEKGDLYIICMIKSPTELSDKDKDAIMSLSDIESHQEYEDKKAIESYLEKIKNGF